MPGNEDLRLAQHWRTFFKGEYINAADFHQGPRKVTISGIEWRDVTDPTGRTEKDVLVILLKESDRALIPSKTLISQFDDAGFGETPGEWIGKQPTLFRDTNVRGKGGQRVGGIRLWKGPER